MKTPFDFIFFENSCSIKAQYSDPFQGVSHCTTFLGVCMFECIPLQTFEKNSQYFFI